MGRILPLLLIVSLTVSRISCEEPNFPSNYASNYNYDSSSPPEEPGFENEPPQHRGLEEEPELGVVEDQIPMGTGESPQLPQFMQGFPTRNDNRQGSFEQSDNANVGQLVNQTPNVRNPSKDAIIKRRRKLKRLRSQNLMAPAPSPPSLLERTPNPPQHGQHTQRQQKVVQNPRKIQSQQQYQAYQQQEEQPEAVIPESRQISPPTQRKYPQYPHKQRNNGNANNLQTLPVSTHPQQQTKTFRQYQVPLTQYYGNTFNYQQPDHQPHPQPHPQLQQRAFTAPQQSQTQKYDSYLPIKQTHQNPVPNYAMPVLGQRQQGQGHHHPQGQPQHHAQVQESRQIPQLSAYPPTYYIQRHPNPRNHRQFPHRPTHPRSRPQHPGHTQSHARALFPTPNNSPPPQFPAPPQFPPQFVAPEIMLPSHTHLSHRAGPYTRASLTHEEDPEEYYRSNGYTPGSPDSYGPPLSSPYDTESPALKRKQKKKPKASKPKKPAPEKVIEGTDPEETDPEADQASFPVRVYKKTKNIVVNTASAVFGAPKFIYTRYKKAYNNFGAARKRSSKGPTKEVSTTPRDRGAEWEEEVEDATTGYADTDAESEWRLHAPVKYEEHTVSGSGWGWGLGGGRSLGRRRGPVEGGGQRLQIVRRTRGRGQQEPNRMGQPHPGQFGRKLHYAGDGCGSRNEDERLLSLPARNWNTWTRAGSRFHG